jgi:hypothetical protein
MLATGFDSDSRVRMLVCSECTEEVSVNLV